MRREVEKFDNLKLSDLLNPSLTSQIPSCVLMTGKSSQRYCRNEDGHGIMDVDRERIPKMRNRAITSLLHLLRRAHFLEPIQFVAIVIQIRKVTSRKHNFERTSRKWTRLNFQFPNGSNHGVPSPAFSFSRCSPVSFRVFTHALASQNLFFLDSL